MGTVTEFPPRLSCPLCGSSLRPATRAEINADLKDESYKQVAESAAQGSREWEPSDEWPDWLKIISPPASWLFRCDHCGNRTLWSRE